MDADRRKPWQRNIAETDKARLVLKAMGRTLSARYTWALGQRIGNIATAMCSIAGVVYLVREDRIKLLEFQNPVDSYRAPELAAERAAVRERAAVHERLAKRCRELHGPPEYTFIKGTHPAGVRPIPGLRDISRRYFREEPTIGTGPLGLFFQFVNLAIEQFGDGAEPVTPDTSAMPCGVTTAMVTLVLGSIKIARVPLLS
jgi:hypothetical protein